MELKPKEEVNIGVPEGMIVAKFFEFLQKLISRLDSHDLCKQNLTDVFHLLQNKVVRIEISR